MQEARKNAGFEVADRIALWWTSEDANIALMWAAHADEIAAEVLATSVTNGDGGAVKVHVAEVPGTVGITRQA